MADLKTGCPMKKNIVLCGFMGCGKTTVGRIVAERTGMTFTDTDDVVRDIAGESIHDMLVDGRLSSVRAYEKEAVLLLAQKENLVISTGAGVFTVEENARAFHETGLVFYLQRSFDLVYPVISRDPVRVMAYRKSYAELKALMEARDALYAKYADGIIANDGDPADSAEKILHFRDL